MEDLLTSDLLTSDLLTSDLLTSKWYGANNGSSGWPRQNISRCFADHLLKCPLGIETNSLAIQRANALANYCELNCDRKLSFMQSLYEKDKAFALQYMLVVLVVEGKHPLGVHLT